MCSLARITILMQFPRLFLFDWLFTLRSNRKLSGRSNASQFMYLNVTSAAHGPNILSPRAVLRNVETQRCFLCLKYNRFHDDKRILQFSKLKYHNVQALHESLLAMYGASYTNQISDMELPYGRLTFRDAWSVPKSAFDFQIASIVHNHVLKNMPLFEHCCFQSHTTLLLV